MLWAVLLAAGCGGAPTGGVPPRPGTPSPDARAADARPVSPGVDAATPPAADAGPPPGTDPADGGPADSAYPDTAPADGAAPDAPAGVPGTFARGVRIGIVEGSQSVFIKLGDGSAAMAPSTMRNAEIIEGRPLFVRVHVKPDAGFMARPLRGVLTLLPSEGMPVTLEESKNIAGASDPEKIETTFNFLVPAAQMKPGTKLSAAIYEAAAVESGPAPMSPPRFPASGELDLDVKAGRMELDVVLVPSLGPSGAVDASPERRKRLENHLYDVYPVQKLNVRWREPIRFTGKLDSSGAFAALGRARMSDNAPPSAYYHFLLAYEDGPGGGGLGVAYLVGAGASDGPRRLGITFITKHQVDSLLDTVSHEMGHNHGRNHAPGCGAQGVDNAFPYVGQGPMMAMGRPRGPGIGVSGYSLSDQKLIVARVTHDLMGYCNGTWVSDYTYMGFARRVRAVSAYGGGATRPPGMALGTRSLQGFLSPGGKPHWVLVNGNLVGPDAAPAGEITLADGRAMPARLAVTTLSDDRTRELAVDLPDLGEGDPRTVTVTVDGQRHTVDLDSL